MPGRDCGQVRLENKLWHDESVIALARITMPWFAGSRVRGFAGSLRFVNYPSEFALFLRPESERLGALIKQRKISSD